MSQFDDHDIERFFEDAHEQEVRSTIDEARLDQEDAARYADIVKVLGRHGIVATLRDPRFDTAELDVLLPVKVVATPACLDALSEGTQHAWSFFAEHLVSAKSLVEYGEGQEDNQALEATNRALSTILTAKDIVHADKQAAIRAAETYLAPQMIAKSLIQWGFDPSQEATADPLFDVKASLIRMADETGDDQERHNCEIKRGLRPQVQAMLSNVLPAEHDDFKQLLLAVEVAIMIQFDPVLMSIAEENEGLVEALRKRMRFTMSQEIIERLGLDVYELIKVAIAAAPAYKKLGYRSS